MPGGTADIDAVSARARAALIEVGANPELIARRRLPFFAEATDLVVAHVSASGREHLLGHEAAGRWKEMRALARSDGVELLLVSGFRTFESQLELIKAKLASGDEIDKVLSVVAPPGCSEHHTGRAVDIGTPGCEPLSESFESTAAFAWLATHAGDFSFRMSYPRNNPWGYRYEPWHWCHAPRHSSVGASGS